MKKFALTSLMALCAATAANAANIIDDNPLYLPSKGHFYSVSGMESSTKNADEVIFGEEFGFGITDRWAVKAMTAIRENNWFKMTEWSALGLGLTYRVADYTNWKFDTYGEYMVTPVWANGNNQFLHGSFLDQNDTTYFWTLGVRGGYTAADFTVAGHVEMEYENSKSFNWNNKDASWHILRAGIDGQLVLTKEWNLVAGAEYEKALNRYNEVLGSWELTFGANYNFDSTKFVGAYITKDINHIKTAEANGNWEVANGFGFGAKFGIDF